VGHVTFQKRQFFDENFFDLEKDFSQKRNSFLGNLMVVM